MEPLRVVIIQLRSRKQKQQEAEAARGGEGEEVGLPSSKCMGDELGRLSDLGACSFPNCRSSPGPHVEVVSPRA